MITEDYVSFETAKLLKKKGFKGYSILTIYDENAANAYIKELQEKHLPYNSDDPKLKEFYYTIPTLQMAMKWLREVHHIFLSIQQHMDMSYVWYAYMDGFAKGCDRESHNNTYEQACEAAIKYCLENLV